MLQDIVVKRLEWIGDLQRLRASATLVSLSLQCEGESLSIEVRADRSTEPQTL